MAVKQPGAHDLFIDAGENCCGDDSREQELGVSCRATGSSARHPMAPSPHSPGGVCPRETHTGHCGVGRCQSSYLLPQLQKPVARSFSYSMHCMYLSATRNPPARFSDASGRGMQVMQCCSCIHAPPVWTPLFPGPGTAVPETAPRAPSSVLWKGQVLSHLLHAASVPKSAPLGV